MEATKHFLPMTKKKKKAGIYIDGQVRLLPFGIVEYVCPKEDLDKVLTTLEAKNKSEYGINFKILPYAILRKFLKLKKVPKYDEGKKILWAREYVYIFVLGIREDGEIVGTLELDKGWTHEAI